MMQVVVPLRGRDAGPLLRIAGQQAGEVAVVLQDHVDRTLAPRAGLQGRADLARQALVRTVGHRMDGVQAQPVESILLDPVQRVVDEEGTHEIAVRASEVQRRPPRRRLRRVEELRAVDRQVVAVRTEVVVDDVQDHHQPERVRGIDKTLQVVRTAVRRVGRKRQHAVVPPVARAGEVGHRHQLDDGDAECLQLAQSRRGRRERALGGEGSDMQFVDNGALPRPPSPVLAAPGVRQRVHHLAAPMHVFRIEARRGVGHAEPAANAEPVARAGARVGHHPLVPSIGLRLHRAMRDRTRSACVAHQLDGPAARRPQAKAHAAGLETLGAERHAVAVRVHRRTPRTRTFSERPGSARVAPPSMAGMGSSASCAVSTATCQSPPLGTTNDTSS